MSDELKQLKNELADLAASMKPGHLKFALALLDNKTQEQAYKAAGGKGKNPNSDAANYLATNPSISKYKSLAQKIASIELLPKQIGTFEQKRAMLWGIAQRASILKVGIKGTEDPDTGECTQEIFDASAAKTAVAAIAELNKMDGDLASIKTENKHSHTHEDITEEELDARLAKLRGKAGTA